MHGAKLPTCHQVQTVVQFVLLSGFKSLCDIARNALVCVVAAVAKVVASAQPPVEYTCSKYREAHSAVVGSSAYNKALDIADGVVKRVQVSAFEGFMHSINKF